MKLKRAQWEKNAACHKTNYIFWCIATSSDDEDESPEEHAKMIADVIGSESFFALRVHDKRNSPQIHAFHYSCHPFYIVAGKGD